MVYQGIKPVPHGGSNKVFGKEFTSFISCLLGADRLNWGCEEGPYVMNRAASSMGTSPLWEGAASFGFLPARASEDPRGIEQVAM